MGHGQPPRPRTVPRLNNKPGLIGMDHGTGVVGQRLRRLGEHPVGEPRVGMEAGRVCDDLAVMGVDPRREVHLPVAGLDLGDVREPLLIGPFGGEVPVEAITGSGRGLPLVGAVTPPCGPMLMPPAGFWPRSRCRFSSFRSS